MIRIGRDIIFVHSLCNRGCGTGSGQAGYPYARSSRGLAAIGLRPSEAGANSLTPRISFSLLWTDSGCLFAGVSIFPPLLPTAILPFPG
jgi:hypothetical protein